MAIVVGGIGIPLGKDEDLRPAAAKKLGIKPSEINHLRVKKQSVDSRKNDIRLVYTLHITLYDTELQHRLETKLGKAQDYTDPDIDYGSKNPGQPVIVGAGPCGLFAALTLARHGYKPLLLERGCDIGARTLDVARLASAGILNEQSNVCFGAGGAGAFSDGKLTTRIKDSRVEYVLKILTECGAPQEIMYHAKPHTGTEHIRTAVSGVIDRIRSYGGDVVFNSRLSGIKSANGMLTSVTYTKDGIAQTIDTHAAVLAIGHSARDTYEMLLGSGVAMAPKPFAIGLRIEHPRIMIDKVQYGDAHAHPMLGAAEYRLATHHQQRSVYTFCMCPGGEVICSATEPDGMAVNGMSYYNRDSENSNSAVVVSVGTRDFESHALGGVAFQRMFERLAFTTGFGAPVQRLDDFFAGRVSQKLGSVKPSYKPLTVCKDLNACLPSFASCALKGGLRHFGQKIRGFDMPDAVLTGVETRTSSPVRILRQRDFQAEGLRGLYPAGEGAGYAGGIMSAAVDGIKSAEALMREYARPDA